MTLTLGTIRDRSPCERGWRTLTKALGTTAPETELSIGDVVLANGLDDALWCLQCLEPRQRVAAIMPTVRRVSAITADQRVHDCISAVQRWLDGDDSVDLRAAEAAARAAARAARATARATARAAADAADAAAGAAGAARATQAAAWAAERAAWAAEMAAWATQAALGPDERDRQITDLLAMFPPIRLKETT